MKFLADENFPQTSVRLLRAEGHEISSASLLYHGQPDENILSQAANEQSVILTFDRDYGKLIYQLNLPKPGGILYFRMQPLTPDEPAMLIFEMLRQNLQIEGLFTTFSRNRIRQRPI